MKKETCHSWVLPVIPGFLSSQKQAFRFYTLLFHYCHLLLQRLPFRMYFGNEEWKLNESLTLLTALKATWWNIKSVLFEELIFRGVLFYILIKQLGVAKAITISAIAFGIYHWFSQGVFGDTDQMIITFLLTGIMGALYAYGYTKSFSLFIPCGIHLGWNLTQGFIFSQGRGSYFPRDL